MWRRSRSWCRSRRETPGLGFRGQGPGLFRLILPMQASLLPMQANLPCSSAGLLAVRRSVRVIRDRGFGTPGPAFWLRRKSPVPEPGSRNPNLRLSVLLVRLRRLLRIGRLLGSGRLFRLLPRRREGALDLLPRALEAAFQLGGDGRAGLLHADEDVFRFEQGVTQGTGDLSEIAL